MPDEPVDGACLAPPGASVTTVVPGGGIAGFAVFITATDRVAPSLSRNRMFVRFRDTAGVTRGSTSLAVEVR